MQNHLKIGDVVEIRDVLSEYYAMKGLVGSIDFDVLPFGEVWYKIDVVNSLGRKIGEYITANLEGIKLSEGEW